MDWREHYARAAARYAAGETRELDERQLVQLANSAWAAGLSLLMAGDREEAAEWLRRSAARYRESWDAGLGRCVGTPIAAMKALLIAGDDAHEVAQWTLEHAVRARRIADRPLRRRARAARARPDGEAGELAATLGDEFPSDVAAALAALAARDADAYAAASARVLRSFGEQEKFLEDVPVSDTALALDALAARRGLA